MDSTYVSSLLSNGHSPGLDALHSYQLDTDRTLTLELETIHMQLEDVVDMRRFDKKLVELGFPSVINTATPANVYIPRRLYVPVLISSQRKMAYHDDLFTLALKNPSSTVGYLMIFFVFGNTYIC
jgi:hypothetical protein